MLLICRNNIDCFPVIHEDFTFTSDSLFCPFHIIKVGPTWPFRKLCYPPSFCPWRKELAAAGSRCASGQAGSHSFVLEEQYFHCSGLLLYLGPATGTCPAHLPVGACARFQRVCVHTSRIRLCDRLKPAHTPLAFAGLLTTKQPAAGQHESDVLPP